MSLVKLSDIQKMSRQIAEEDGLAEIAKLYPSGGMSVRCRSRGWAMSRYREVRE